MKVQLQLIFSRELCHEQAQIARHTAALALAKVAAIELPNKQWQDLVPSLLQNMNTQPPNPGLKQSTLESLGYVCEEMGKLEEDVLAQEQINSILTAVVQVSHERVRADSAPSSSFLRVTCKIICVWRGIQ